VDVLDDHDERAVLGQALEEAPPGSEEILTIGGASLAEAEQLEQPRLDPRSLLGVGDVKLEHRDELLGRRRRILALLRIISASAQKATPSPYERQRPRCHQTSPARPSMYFSNSHDSRVLPIPATPTTDTTFARLSSAVA
jgi:hypothetical protein